MSRVARPVRRDGRPEKRPCPRRRPPVRSRVSSASAPRPDRGYGRAPSPFWSPPPSSSPSASGHLGPACCVGRPVSSGGGGGRDGFQLSGLIGCFGRGPGFSPDLLVSGTPSAETAAGAPASALRAFLAQNPDMPASGWTMISGSGSMVTYLAPVPDAPGNDYVEVAFEPGTPGNGSYGADGWRTAGYGSCRLVAVSPSGYGPATWALDPATPYSAGSTQLHVLVDEWACHSFATAEGRIIQNVQYDADAVVVTLAVLARQGPQLCPGTPPTPYVVLLTQPVGTRTLTDGTPWPPALIAVAGSPFYTPSPTPNPSNWHMPMDCTGEADGPGSFKAASMMAKFEVYLRLAPGRVAAGGDERLRAGRDLGRRHLSGPERRDLRADRGRLLHGKRERLRARRDRPGHRPPSATCRAGSSEGRRTRTLRCMWPRVSRRRGRLPGRA